MQLNEALEVLSNLADGYDPPVGEVAATDIARQSSEALLALLLALKLPRGEAVRSRGPE